MKESDNNLLICRWYGLVGDGRTLGRNDTQRTSGLIMRWKNVLYSERSIGSLNIRILYAVPWTPYPKRVDHLHFHR